MCLQCHSLDFSAAPGKDKRQIAVFLSVFKPALRRVRSAAAAALWRFPGRLLLPRNAASLRVAGPVWLRAYSLTVAASPVPVSPVAASTVLVLVLVASLASEAALSSPLAASLSSLSAPFSHSPLSTWPEA